MRAGTLEPTSLRLGSVSARLHRTNADDGVPLAVTRLPCRGGVPVMCVHGNYSKRNFWVSDRGIGLGAWLSAKGFDVWIPELRGHGESPKTRAFSRYTADDHVRRDLPAAQRLVERIAGRPAHVVAHSAGGLFVMMALAASWLRSDQVRSVSLFGTQIDEGERYLGFPGVASAISALLRLMGRLPAARLGLGPENEPAGEMLEMLRWKVTGRWRSPDGIDFREALERITVPVRAFAGAADRNDPASGCRRLLDRVGSQHKRFTLLGREGGFSRDYGHVDMLVSKAAQREVWPLLLDWLESGHAAAG